jgi:hypothetical protein
VIVALTNGVEQELVAGLPASSALLKRELPADFRAVRRKIHEHYFRPEPEP